MEIPIFLSLRLVIFWWKEAECPPLLLLQSGPEVVLSIFSHPWALILSWSKADFSVISHVCLNNSNIAFALIGAAMMRLIFKMATWRKQFWDVWRFFSVTLYIGRFILVKVGHANFTGGFQPSLSPPHCPSLPSLALFLTWPLLPATPPLTRPNCLPELRGYLFLPPSSLSSATPISARAWHHFV